MNRPPEPGDRKGRPYYAYGCIGWGRPSIVGEPFVANTFQIGRLVEDTGRATIPVPQTGCKGPPLHITAIPVPRTGFPRPYYTPIPLLRVEEEVGDWWKGQMQVLSLALRVPTPITVWGVRFNNLKGVERTCKR